ncbi:DUF4488 domain-containing protein [Maribellus sp. YY47]|uniref:DUF4488 domain-containing protein n=1 Tax=Maribellus sp. YY47 TaxID=2929486 RepID=UPI002000E39A|nr:DUF4488 domain-containing protein [Maribellus sp. YY47]MCK3683265.1 DUF4488 domain-containing protein [Maribellus sp. YY47]
MKTTILTTVFLVLSVVVLKAQDSFNMNPFEGVWQMYIPVGGNPLVENKENGELSLDSAKVRPGYNYKIFSADGHFVTLFATQMVSKLTIMGTYEVLSPGIYIEHVKEHTNPAYANKDTELEYRFIGDDIFIMTYENEFGNKSLEVWKQVTFGNPMEELVRLRQLEQKKN